MKTQIISTPLITSEDMDTSKMGMDLAGIDMATYYLRDKIYQDKILAVVREYICNALDEHEKYGIVQPVEVSLNTSEHIFKVRDFAKGLSESDIRNIFGMYFKSTKSDTNKLIGGFGIGSKAGHAYTDTFYVKSFYNNVVTLYACVLGGGDSNVPVGQILKVSEEETTESGIEISLTVEQGDRTSFYKHTKRMVDTCNKSIKFTYDSEVFEPLKPVAVFHSDNLTFKVFEKPTAYFYQGVNILFKMGNVNYHTKTFDFTKRLSAYNLLENCIYVIEFPIGSMTIPISRESFESNEKNNQLMDKAQKILSDDILELDKSNLPKHSIVEQLEHNKKFVQIGQWFSFYKQYLYPETFPFIKSLNRCENDVTTLEKEDDKFLVAIVPNSKRSNRGMMEFLNSCALNNKNYCYVNSTFDTNFTGFSKENSKYFILKPARNKVFKFPNHKKTAQNTTFTVRIFNTWKIERFTGSVLEIHNNSCMRYNLPTVSSLTEIKDQIAKMNFVSLEHLGAFTIEYGCSTTKRSISCNNKILQEKLVKLGWFLYDSPEYKVVADSITKKIKERQQNQVIFSSCSIKFLMDDDKVKLAKKVSTKIKYAERIYKTLQRIKTETSTRGKIIRGYYALFSQEEHYSGFFNNQSLSRSELRAILKLK